MNYWAVGRISALALYAGYCVSGYVTTAKAEEVKSPIVLELFTSQSCSSCPSADKQLTALVQNPHVIALSCNVTYWNHLSWKDTLSLDVCSKRQREYSTAQQRGGRVFTPELMINGRYSVVGSNERDISERIADSQHDITALNIELNTNSTALKVSAQGSWQPRPSYYYSIISYGSNHSETINSGENHGRTVEYTNPVKSIRTLDIGWNNSSDFANVALSKSEQSSSSSLVLLIQDSLQGNKIIAAGKMERSSN